MSSGDMPLPSGRVMRSRTAKTPAEDGGRAPPKAPATRLTRASAKTAATLAEEARLGAKFLEDNTTVAQVGNVLKWYYDRKQAPTAMEVAEALKMEVLPEILGYMSSQINEEIGKRIKFPQFRDDLSYEIKQDIIKKLEAAKEELKTQLEGHVQQSKKYITAKTDDVVQKLAACCEKDSHWMERFAGELGELQIILGQQQNAAYERLNNLPVGGEEAAASENESGAAVVEEQPTSATSALPMPSDFAKLKSVVEEVQGVVVQVCQDFHNYRAIVDKLVVDCSGAALPGASLSTSQLKELLESRIDEHSEEFISVYKQLKKATQDSESNAKQSNEIETEIVTLKTDLKEARGEIKSLQEMMQKQDERMDRQDKKWGVQVKVLLNIVKGMNRTIRPVADEATEVEPAAPTTTTPDDAGHGKQPDGTMSSHAIEDNQSLGVKADSGPGSSLVGGNGAQSTDSSIEEPKLLDAVEDKQGKGTKDDPIPLSSPVIEKEAGIMDINAKASSQLTGAGARRTKRSFSAARETFDTASQSSFRNQSSLNGQKLTTSASPVSKKARHANHQDDRDRSRICTNCGQAHSGNCRKKCSGCGSDKHLRDKCEHIDLTCPCKPLSYHYIYECKKADGSLTDDALGVIPFWIAPRDMTISPEWRSHEIRSYIRRRRREKEEAQKKREEEEAQKKREDEEAKRSNTK